MESKIKTTEGLILSAVKFAANKHRTHRRKDAEASSYINHPIELRWPP